MKWRIQTYGTQIFEGDLILTSNSRDYDDDSIDDSTPVPINNNNYKEKRKDINNNISKVYRITKEDIELKRYTIKDVVLPLLGMNMEYPNNTIGDYYKNMIQEKLTISQEKLKLLRTNYALNGGYRHIMSIPQHVKHIYVSNDIDPSLLLSFHDQMISFEEASKQSFFPLPTTSSSQKALLCQFQLIKGSYATELLRYLSHGGIQQQ
ncbi:hypothetical protein WA158_001154 [Blastocystis sp. Blastoise]